MGGRGDGWRGMVPGAEAPGWDHGKPAEAGSDASGFGAGLPPFHFLSAAPRRTTASHHPLARSEGEGLSRGRRSIQCSGACAWPSKLPHAPPSGTSPRRRTLRGSSREFIRSWRRTFLDCGKTDPEKRLRRLPKTRAATWGCPYGYRGVRCRCGAAPYGRRDSRPYDNPAEASPRRRTLCCCCREFTRRVGHRPLRDSPATPRRTPPRGRRQPRHPGTSRGRRPGSGGGSGAPGR